jgi:hypothetical protein
MRGSLSRVWVLEANFGTRMRRTGLSCKAILNAVAVRRVPGTVASGQIVPHSLANFDVVASVALRP